MLDERGHKHKKQQYWEGHYEETADPQQQSPDESRAHHKRRPFIGRPLTRALIKHKRKSKPDYDEAQDSGRAIVVEEGLTAWIFTRAKELNFFEGQDRVLAWHAQDHRRVRDRL